MGELGGEIPTFLVTGANGFFGTQVTAAILRRGHRVLAAVRGGEGRSDSVARERVLAALAEAGQPVSDPALGIGERLHPFHMDVLEEGLGLGEYAKSLLKRWTPRTVVHTAASLRHSERHAEDTRAVNVDGAARVLDACREFGIAHFTAVGTAYVHGRASGSMPEELYSSIEPLNFYDRTKWAQEKLIAGSGIPYLIFRPSILVGPFETGAGHGLDSYYGFVWGLYLMREAHCGFAGNPPVVAVRIRANAQASVNVIPTDWAAQAIADVVTRPVVPAQPRIVHLTDDRPVNLGAHVAWIEEALGGLELSIHPPDALSAAEMTIFDHQFEMMIDFQKAYIQNEVRYETGGRKALGISDPPSVNREVMLRQLRHATGRFATVGPKNERFIERLRETARQARGA